MMSVNKLNLVSPAGIQHSNLFVHLPLFDDIFYEGIVDKNVRKFKAVREDQPCQIAALSIIRKDEDIVWDALEDVVGRSVAQAAFGVHGIYTFELLTVDIHNEIKTFNPNELTEIIINQSRKLTPGQSRLVKYSSVYGILQKMVHEDWGKIVFKTTLEVFKDKPVFLDLLVKRLIKDFEFSHAPGILLLNDLSLQPLFDAQDDLQQQRLRQVLDAQIPKSIAFPPEVYIQDKNGVRELLSGAIIK